MLITTNVCQRSSDGLTLLISSSDGFCSTLSFSSSDLGQVYTGEIPTAAQKARQRTEVSETAVTSSQNTPIPTPTSVFAPPSPFPNGQHRHRDSASSLTAPSPPPMASFVNQRPSSPARSNSTSSVITQASTAGGVITNPTLIGGNVPSIAAANSGKVVGIPITTPPETPRSTANNAAGTKRDASESEQEETAGEPKKRRIAPTLISSGDQ